MYTITSRKQVLGPFILGIIVLGLGIFSTLIMIDPYILNPGGRPIEIHYFGVYIVTFLCYIYGFITILLFFVNPEALRIMFKMKRGRPITTTKTKKSAKSSGSNTCYKCGKVIPASEMQCEECKKKTRALLG